MIRCERHALPSCTSLASSVQVAFEVIQPLNQANHKYTIALLIVIVTTSLEFVVLAQLFFFMIDERITEEG